MKHMKHMKHTKHMKHMKHTQHTKHIQQCQCSTAPTIFIEKTAHFQRSKKTGYGPSDQPTDHRTDGHNLI